MSQCTFKLNVFKIKKREAILHCCFQQTLARLLLLQFCFALNFFIISFTLFLVSHHFFYSYLNECMLLYNVVVFLVIKRSQVLKTTFNNVYYSSSIVNVLITIQNAKCALDLTVSVCLDLLF